MKGRWGWAQAPRSRPKKYGCRTCTPRAERKRSIAARTMGVGSSTSNSAEKIWLQDLYAPRREETIHRRKDDGGGLKHLDLGRKNMAAGPIPPRAEEDRSISERTTGGQA